MINVLLADDHELVRAGIKALLEKAHDIRVIAEATNGREAVILFNQINPDVVILDISMPIMDGLEACKQIIKSDKRARILILTVYPEKQYATRILASGALGYVTKKVGPNELYAAVRQVANNELFIEESSKDLILTKLLNLKGRTNELDVLSDRELQVLQLLGQGKGIKEIATELNLSVKTVDNYRYRMLSKLDLKRTVELALLAQQLNIS